jgi:hypothetical protein
VLLLCPLGKPAMLQPDLQCCVSYAAYKARHTQHTRVVLRGASQLTLHPAGPACLLFAPADKNPVLREFATEVSKIINEAVAGLQRDDV